MAMRTMSKRSFSVDGVVARIEEARGKILWVAFVLQDTPVWKVIFSGAKAENALAQVAVGDTITAVGHLIKSEESIIKFFADELVVFPSN